MTTYPRGVVQNYNNQGTAPLWGAVPQKDWRAFSNEAEALTGLEMIKAIADSSQPPEMEENTNPKYKYVKPSIDIRCRIVYATVKGLMVAEFPSDIFDRNLVPQPMIDKYSPGEPHVLDVNEIAPEIGELYWKKA